MKGSNVLLYIPSSAYYQLITFKIPSESESLSLALIPTTVPALSQEAGDLSLRRVDRSLGLRYFYHQVDRALSAAAF